MEFKVRVWLGLFALWGALPSAWAQAPIKPSMLIIFDTSGSMTWSPINYGPCNGMCNTGYCSGTICIDPTFGDGSLDRPGIDTDGNHYPDDSRMFIMKEALTTALWGTSEIQFGLMRYHQVQGLNARPSPDQWATGWACTAYDDRTTCSGSSMPPANPNASLNYDGYAEECRGGDLLVPIEADNPGGSVIDILEWIDHTENFQGGNFELRGDGATPIAASLSSAFDYFQDYVIPGDPFSDCGSYYVLLLTDGEETCYGNPQQEAQRLRSVDVAGRDYDVKTYVIGFGGNTVGSGALNGIAQAGGTNAAFFAEDASSLQIAMNTIIQDAIPQEECNGLDDDCNGLIDEFLFRPCETTCGHGTETCVNGRWQHCSAQAPANEICDGEDNNCNGQVDENLSQECRTSCGRGTEFCINGAWRECDAPLPNPEACNGRDDDCDGDIDEDTVRACFTNCGTGVERCVNGAWTECDAPLPTGAETCNGLDDNCNGEIDEGLERPCENLCGQTGIEVCWMGDWVNCSAPIPAAEVCNGMDDDCDGVVDNDLEPVPCTTTCGEGTMACENGRLTACSAPLPRPEECNNADDDCDGEVDEQLIQACNTACTSGYQVCVAGEWGECNAPPVGDEICDCVDNDCNGVVDDNVPCEQLGQSCVHCQCVLPCAMNECPPGQICTDGFCFPDPCFELVCSEGLECVDGACLDVNCAAVECPEGEVCDLGICVVADCYVLGCEPGFICREGECVTDPCPECPEGLFCRVTEGAEGYEGECVESCAGIVCADGQRCEYGACVVDTCLAMECEPLQFCEAGECLPDPCTDIKCSRGRVCRGGVCVDSPCLDLICPPGQECMDGQCYTSPDQPDGGPPVYVDVPVIPIDPWPPIDPVVPPPPTEEEDKGCGCAIQGDPTGSLWPPMLLLAALALALRPNRRWLLVLILAALVGGCGTDDDTTVDAALPPPPPPVCIPTMEYCDGLDNDCDGVPDNGFDFLFDPKNCGACGYRCLPPNARGACDNARCIVESCLDGYRDDDGDPNTGCEVVECVRTNGGVERCDGVDNDCDGLIDEGINPDQDPMNCGVCGEVCSFPNADAQCLGGVCIIGSCLEGFFDLDNDADNGCEYVCTSTGEEVCDHEDNNCNGEIDEGFDLSSDLENCGDCGSRCDISHGTGACLGGACVLFMCEAGYMDEDNDPSNGCEAECHATGEEVCDNVDNDCDGLTDEDFDFLNDLENCGGCDNVCDLPYAATMFCNGGHCDVITCEDGHRNADRDPENGCECVYSGHEVCDGLDNDCSGEADDNLGGPPDGFEACMVRGECWGTRPACIEGEWTCAYPETYEEDEESCDGLDNDCDGLVDEAFTNLNQPCWVGRGICEEKGTYICTPDGRGVMCSEQAHPERATDEVCNGLDDDCDGQVDEDSQRAVAIRGGGLDFLMFQFEASRTDANGADPGSSFMWACSRQGVLPWNNVDWYEAETACEDAGWRLCTKEEWEWACSGGTLEWTYPYGFDFESGTCNGLELNAQIVLPTGQLTECATAGQPVYDMSGNVWEWLDHPVGSYAKAFQGGGFENVAGGLTCSYMNSGVPETYRNNLGFRCCKDN